MNIGKIVKKLRKEKKLTQEELAQRVSITQTALSMIESGTTTPHDSTLKKLAAELGLSVPLFYFLALDEADIPASKRELYKALSPTLNSIITQIALEDDESPDSI